MLQKKVGGKKEDRLNLKMDIKMKEHDWVDSDNQPLNFGAENYFYIGPTSKISQFDRTFE